MKRISLVVLLLLISASIAWGQKQRVKNQPYADLKLYHLGFHVGLHTQDLLLTNSGVTSDGQVWFAEIPTYTPGFSVGVIGDMYLNPYFSLRVLPTLNFGDRKVIFRKQHSENEAEDVSVSLRSNYMSLPLQIKYAALRLNNYRPYITGGVYAAMDLGRKKGTELMLKGMDYGVEIGFGCDIYLPYFKLCPELRFSFGLADVLEKDRSDLSDPDMQKYTNALSKATTRMITLSFNFE
ncbi:porin family protein [Parabacteroides sp. Marseille-P3160]|uniref:type IX secretion/gliding motility protein PorT/SprT n=1 Tax=Parabacteroides sp. Marseille-P3160 TaxID=1917887 RepID=UPI0009BB700B|nr:porin family protein [Parabacteroides sp. Marseille-P3160]